MPNQEFSLSQLPPVEVSRFLNGDGGPFFKPEDKQRPFPGDDPDWLRKLELTTGTLEVKFGEVWNQKFGCNLRVVKITHRYEDRLNTVLIWNPVFDGPMRFGNPYQASRGETSFDLAIKGQNAITVVIPQNSIIIHTIEGDVPIKYNDDPLAKSTNGQSV